MNNYTEDFALFRNIILKTIEYSVVVNKVNLPILGNDKKDLQNFFYRGGRSFEGRKPRLLSGAFGNTEAPMEPIVDNIKNVINTCFIDFNFIKEDFLQYVGSYKKNKTLAFIAKYLTTTTIGTNEYNMQQRMIKSDETIPLDTLNQYFSSSAVHSVNFGEANPSAEYIFNPQNTLKSISGSEGGSSKYKGLELIITLNNYPLDKNFTFFIFNTSVKGKVDNFEFYPSKIIPELCDVDVTAEEFLDKDNEKSLYQHISKIYEDKEPKTFDFLTCLIDICTENKHSIEDKNTFNVNELIEDSSAIKKYKELINQDDIWAKVNAGLNSQFGELLSGVFVLTSDEYKDKDNLRINYPGDSTTKMFDFFIKFDEDENEVVHSFSIKARSAAFGHPIEFDNYVYPIREYYEHHSDDDLFNPNNDKELDDLLKMFEFEEPNVTSEITNEMMWPQGKKFFGKRRFVLLNFVYDVIMNNNDKGFVNSDFCDTFLNYEEEKDVKDEFIGQMKNLLSENKYSELEVIDNFESSCSIDDINKYLKAVYDSAGVGKSSPYIINEATKQKMSHFYKSFQNAICKELNKKYSSEDNNVLTQWMHNIMEVDAYQLTCAINKTNLSFTNSDMNVGSYEFTAAASTSKEAFEHTNLAIHMKK